ncbi:MAG TPA: hypothetical protein ENH40_02435, partial [Nitrospirae bacterium]|nr:hypothetical protein [Nitrospirota bacterium]
SDLQLISDPPWVIPESMKGKMRIKPRGMMYYRDHTMLPKPLSTGINYLPLDKELERRKNIIDNHYMVAFFTMLMQAQKTMTATEILEKKSEQVAVLSPMLIIFTDFLTRVIDRTHNKAKSRMPKVPPGMDIRKIKLRFIGPLPRARQKLQEQGILRTLQALGESMKLIPGSEQSADYVNMDEITKHILKYDSAPARVVREDREVEEIRRIRAELAAQQRQIEAMQAQGQAYGNMNQAPVPGSPAEAAIG